MQRQDRIAYLNARLVDPASGLDEMGALLTEGDQIVDLGPNLFKKGAPSVDQRVDCQGHVLAPGLIDARVHCPNLEQDNTAGQKDGVTSIGHAALSGGITSIIQLPDTDPVTDSPTIVDSLWRHRQSVKGPALVCDRRRDSGAARRRNHRNWLVRRSRGGGFWRLKAGYFLPQADAPPFILWQCA